MYELIYQKLLLPAFETGWKKRKTLKYWDHAQDSQWWSREGQERHQFKSLRKLVKHAGETCPYYREQFVKHGVDYRNLKSLDEFERAPLLTRETIKENRDMISSEKEINRFEKATGGSSGEPLRFELSMESHERRVAMTYRGYSWAGAAPGTRQLYLWGTHLGPMPKWKQFKHDLHMKFNNQKLLSCFEMTPEKMAEYVQEYNKYKPKVIVAYTNAVYEFARFIRDENLDVIPPHSIVVGAEKLYDHQRELIENVFQAPVFETYGSREFMLIGAECEYHNGLHLSMENLYVEILDEDGKPTPEGEEGNIVITDLHNYAMPFIRYVNGDRAIAGFEKCPCERGLPLLKKVVGRQSDTLDTPDGKKLPGAFFPHLIKDFPSVLKFQVNQISPEHIQLKLIVRKDFNQNIQERIAGIIRENLGNGVHLEMEIVDEIPLTQAGKHRIVVKHF